MTRCPHHVDDQGYEIGIERESAPPALRHALCLGLRVERASADAAQTRRDRGGTPEEQRSDNPSLEERERWRAAAHVAFSPFGRTAFRHWGFSLPGGLGLPPGRRVGPRLLKV